jgi:hypothetical protein
MHHTSQQVDRQENASVTLCRTQPRPSHGRGCASHQSAMEGRQLPHSVTLHRVHHRPECRRVLHPDEDVYRVPKLQVSVPLCCFVCRLAVLRGIFVHIAVSPKLSSDTWHDVGVVRICVNHVPGQGSLKFATNVASHLPIFIIEFHQQRSHFDVKLQ